MNNGTKICPVCHALYLWISFEFLCLERMYNDIVHVETTKNWPRVWFLTFEHCYIYKCFMIWNLFCISFYSYSNDLQTFMYSFGMVQSLIKRGIDAAKCQTFKRYNFCSSLSFYLNLSPDIKNQKIVELMNFGGRSFVGLWWAWTWLKKLKN